MSRSQVRHRELPAWTPLKPGEAPPGKAMLAIPVQLVAQPRFGAPRFGQPSQEQPRSSRNTRDSAPGPLRAPGPGRTAGRARAEVPGRARRIPAPLGSSSGPGFFPGPGRVFHSTVWLRKDGDALGAQGADCGHKSPCGPSFPLLSRGGCRLASRPRPHRLPCFPGHGLETRRLRGESSQ